MLVVVFAVRCKHRADVHNHKIQTMESAKKTITKAGSGSGGVSSGTLSKIHNHHHHHQQHYGTAQRKLNNHQQPYSNGSLHLFANDYEADNGVLPVPSVNQHLMEQRHQGSSNESDSWMESSRSRDTSPASSIPPGMPAFRVIPLCENDGGNSHVSSDPFTLLRGTPMNRYSSNHGSEIGSSSDRPFLPSSSLSIVRARSETGSEADPLQRLNGNTLPNGNGPLLRRNQYWV